MVAIARALKHRNYRLFFGGQGISLTGSWMTRIATQWLVARLMYDRPEAALWLGLVAFCSHGPALLLAPVAGVFLDRLDLRRVLLVTQALAMVQAALLALLTLAGSITLRDIVLLSLLRGVINAVDNPARQALLPQMVDARADLSNAIALNSSMVHGARLVGPALAGVLILVYNEGVCFLVDAVSYLAVLGSLTAMRLPPRPAPAGDGHFLRDLHAGLRYAAGFAPIRTVLLFLAGIGLLGNAYVVVLPIVVQTTLDGGPPAFGALTAAGAAGSLLGALYLAWRPSVVGLKSAIAVGAVLHALALIAFSGSRWMPLALVLAPLVGLGTMIQMAGSNTFLQTIVDDDKRARVMSLFTMCVFGVMPFGALLAGALATWLGASATLLISGLGCLLVAGTFASRIPRLRALVQPVYVRKGLTPAATLGIDSAGEVPLAPAPLDAARDASAPRRQERVWP